METVSPLIYKKLDFTAFSTAEKTESKPVEKILYDPVSKKIIQFSEENIKIFNRDLSMIKKNMKLKLSVDKINRVSVEKQLRYMLVCMDKIILIINLRTEKVFEILHLESNNLLGAFFISYCHIHPSYYNEDIRFCLVFTNRIIFQKLTFILNEKITEIKSIKIEGIREYFYNPQFLVLLIRKGEYEFEFFNLINEKFYFKSHLFEIPNKVERKSSLSKFFGFFSKKEEVKDEDVIPEDITKEYLYKRTHYFLETM